MEQQTGGKDHSRIRCNHVLPLHSHSSDLKIDTIKCNYVDHLLKQMTKLSYLCKKITIKTLKLEINHWMFLDHNSNCTIVCPSFKFVFGKTKVRNRNRKQLNCQVLMLQIVLMVQMVWIKFMVLMVPMMFMVLSGQMVLMHVTS